MIKKSLTLRVLVVSFLCLAVPLLIDSFVFFKDSYREAIKNAKHDLKEMAGFRTFSLNEIEPVKQTLLSEMIAAFKLGEKIERGETDQMSELIAKVAEDSGEFQVFILGLSEGPTYPILASSVFSMVGEKFTSYDLINEILKMKEGSAIRYEYSEDTHTYTPYYFIGQTIYSPQTKKPVGIIVLSAFVEGALHDILKPDRSQGDIQFALLNKDGIVFAASEPNLAGNYFDNLTESRKHEILETKQLGLSTLPDLPLPVIHGDDPTFFEFVFNDQIQIAYRAYSSGSHLSVLSYAPKVEFFGTAVRRFLLLYSIYGLILIVGGGFTYWLAAFVSRPLTKLSHLMGEVGRGNLSVRFNKEPLGFEINLLGNIFNGTLDNLLENIQRAQDERVEKEIYEREVMIGHEVQKNLLPQEAPNIEGIEIASYYQRAKEVGGDFYGYFEKEWEGEKTLSLFVADAQAKGLSASLYASSIRSLLYTYGSLDPDPSKVLMQTNLAFIEDVSDEKLLMSLFLATLSLESKTLRYACAGQVPALVKRKGGKSIFLKNTSPPIGQRRDALFTSRTIELERGDLVLIYSTSILDGGISEETLANIFEKQTVTSAQECLELIKEEVNPYNGDQNSEDEKIILILKIL